MIKGCDRLTQPYVKEPIDHSSKPDTQSKALALNISKWLAIILSIEVPHKQLYRCGLHRTRKRESIIGSRCEDSSLLRRNPGPYSFLPPIPTSHHRAFVAACRLRRVLRSLNFSNNQVKCPLNVVSKAGASFSKCAAKFFSQLPAFIQRDLSLFRLEITLVPHNRQRYGVCPL